MAKPPDRDANLAVQVKTQGQTTDDCRLPNYPKCCLTDDALRQRCAVLWRQIARLHRVLAHPDVLAVEEQLVVGLAGILPDHVVRARIKHQSGRFFTGFPVDLRTQRRFTDNRAFGDRGVAYGTSNHHWLWHIWRWRTVDQ